MTSPSPARSAARRLSGRTTLNSTGPAIVPRMASGTESVSCSDRRLLKTVRVSTSAAPVTTTRTNVQLVSTSAAPVKTTRTSTQSVSISAAPVRTTCTIVIKC